MNNRLQTIKYFLSDLFSAAFAWTLFFVFRKTYIETAKFGYDIPIVFDQTFFKALIIIPIFWILLYILWGRYRNIYRRSRLLELGQTLLISLIGTIILFFVIILDDEIGGYKYYYISFVALFVFHFLSTFIPRLILTTKTVKAIHNRKIGFNTLLVGSNKNAVAIFEELEKQIISSGNKFVGFVHVENYNGSNLEKLLPKLGNSDHLINIIDKYQVKEVIIAIESSEHYVLNEIINQLEERDVITKVVPDMYDILIGSVKMTAIFGAPLIEITKNIMPAWQISTKRIIDVGVSIIAMTVFSPVFIFVAIGVWLSSKGPLFYSHVRLGLHGKPFKIFKFRSMIVDAEKMGPALSSSNDKRITNFGKIMRKTRLDEIPQFFNVLKGDMSIVGPRPERKFYVDQIVKKAPHYRHLHKVRPGITSWGQVKYGYAENVDQMIERLKYDILYIENMSISIDFKILIYTILIVVKGKGK